MYQNILVKDRIPQPAAVAVPLYEKTEKLPSCYAKLDAQWGGVLAAALKRSDFTPSAGSVTPLYPVGGPRVYALGLGPRDQFHANHLRAAAARLVPLLQAGQAASLSVELALFDSKAESGGVVGEGLGLGCFAFSEFKGTANSGPKKGPARLHVTSDSSEAMEGGLRLAESVNLARDLAATPPNVAHPGYLADYCRKLSRRVGLKCSVIDAQKAKQLGMGGLLAVGGAGSSPPCLIALEWNPPGLKPRATSPILLVGKAVTFDTGGYSIKLPADSMVSMKYDKCGGMTVIGTMHALASLGVRRRVVGLIPAAENLIGQTAYRPADILKLYNGVTVEVNNTDAEGRLILGDALSYGCETYKPAAVVDLATLTGACVVALGPWCAGAFCNDEPLYDKLLASSQATGERIWRMPLWPEHRRHIRGHHGDILNSGGREAGASTAAAFLSHFVARDGDFKKNAPVPWCHLDIAGVADHNTERDPTGTYVKGPTGFGIRLLVHAISNWS